MSQKNHCVGPISSRRIESDESTTLPSQLIDITSGLPNVSDYINDDLGKVFFKRLGTRSYLLIYSKKNFVFRVT